MPVEDKTQANSVISDAAKKAKEFREVDRERPKDGFGVQFLDSPFVIIDNTGSPASAVAWTTFDASAHVPPNAKGVILLYRARNIESPTGEKGIYVRKERNVTEMQIASVRGTSTSDITSNAGQAWCPLTPNLTFDYKADAMSDQVLKIAGFWN